MNQDSETTENTVEGFWDASIFGFGGLSWCLCALLAVYLLFTCNRRFSWPGAIVAILCPCCYVLYIAISKGGFCSGYVRGIKPKDK